MFNNQRAKGYKVLITMIKAKCLQASLFTSSLATDFVCLTFYY